MFLISHKHAILPTWYCINIDYWLWPSYCSVETKLSSNIPTGHNTQKAIHGIKQVYMVYWSSVSWVAKKNETSLKLIVKMLMKKCMGDGKPTDTYLVFRKQFEQASPILRERTAWEANPSVPHLLQSKTGVGFLFNLKLYQTYLPIFQFSAVCCPNSPHSPPKTGSKRQWPQTRKPFFPVNTHNTITA